MAKEIDFSDTLKKLRETADAMPWTKRQEVAAALGRNYESGKASDSTLELVYLLAADGKWEVRKSIANFLPALPEPAQVRLIAELSADPNAFVRNAVDLAISHRRQTKQSSAQQKRGFEQVQADFDALEEEYGRAAANKARRMVDRLYSLMVNKAAHELLGRMTPLKSDTAQMLSRVKDGKFNAREFEDALSDMAERLEFIERFLSKLKAYATAVSTERVRTRLADVVGDAHRQALEKLKAAPVRGASYRAMISDAIQINVARVDMVVALSDLLKNAYESFKDRASKSPAEIRVEARRMSDDTVQLRLRDNGCGMSAADLADVLQFIPGKSSKKVMGTGIGIPNARQVVLQHGGKFELESELDQGTTITVVLPLARREGA